MACLWTITFRQKVTRGVQLFMPNIYQRLVPIENLDNISKNPSSGRSRMFIDEIIMQTTYPNTRYQQNIRQYGNNQRLPITCSEICPRKRTLSLTGGASLIISSRLFSSSCNYSCGNILTVKEKIFASRPIEIEKLHVHSNPYNPQLIADNSNDISGDVPSLEIYLDPLISTEPSFSSLGLSHGWPSGWMQALLEAIHINGSIGWLGTIIITTTMLRLILFPIMLNGRRKMLNINKNLPEMQKHQYAIHIAKTEEELAIANEECKHFLIEKDINPIGQFVPMVLSGIVFSTMFFALRGMANCPVPSMTTGGLGWFLDLSTKDPYFILPIMTAATMALNMRDRKSVV